MACSRSDPSVIRQGFNPVVVDQGLKAQLTALVNAGYNTQETWFGAELASLRIHTVLLKETLCPIKLTSAECAHRK